MEKFRNRYTAFDGVHSIASGTLAEVVRRVKEEIGTDDQKPVLVFNDNDSEQMEIDFRGTVDDVMERLKESNQPGFPEDSEILPRGPGRPKLGVVSREVTLLPRHWDWLSRQPAGASATIRKLVEKAKRSDGEKEEKRRSQDTALRFMSAMAGNLPGFEEAARALYAGNRESFRVYTGDWPVDIRDYAMKLSQAAFSG